MSASNSIETVVICKQVLSENRIDRLTVIALIAVLVVGCFVVLRPFLSAILWAVILSYPTFSLPFAIWLMMGYYSSIPEELEAAALVDGCNRFQTFFQVVLPLTKPALLAVALTR